MLDNVISVAERFATSSKYVLTLNCQLITCFASLIQLVECSTCNRDVGGSIPSTSIGAAYAHTECDERVISHIRVMRF